MTSDPKVLAALLDLQRRVEAAIELVDPTPATDQPLTTAELSAKLGIKPQSLCSWARSHGAGAIRGGSWKLLGRENNTLRARWLWQRVERVAS